MLGSRLEVQAFLTVSKAVSFFCGAVFERLQSRFNT